MPVSSMGKLSKVMTISLLPFFFSFRVWTPQPLDLSQHCATDTGRTCYLNYNHHIVYIFESVRLVHLFHIRLCNFLADIFRIGNLCLKRSWIVIKTPTLIPANHISTFIPLFSYPFLSSLHCNNSFKLHEDNWQTTEMPDEVNAITQIKACLGKKCQKVPPYLSQYLDWDQEILLYLLGYIPVWLTDDGTLNLMMVLYIQYIHQKLQIIPFGTPDFIMLLYVLYIWMVCISYFCTYGEVVAHKKNISNTRIDAH